MKEYLQDLSTNATTPTSDFIFKTKNNAEKLKDQKRQYFHTTEVRGLFITNKISPDIHTVFGYLSTRVKYTNTNDW